METWAQYTQTRINFYFTNEKEFNTITNKIISNNQHLRSVIKNKLIELNDYKSERQFDKKTIAYYEQEIENRILEQVYVYCADKNVITNNVCALRYDGVMILKENYYPELIDELEKLIIDKFGLHLKFEQKAW